MIKTYRYLWSMISGENLQQYKDPYYIGGNFEILKFNYYPFEAIKKRFLMIQIDQKLKKINKQDKAFLRYGMNDVIGH